MPRLRPLKLTSAFMQNYDVEAIIERRFMLMNMYETEMKYLYPSKGWDENSVDLDNIDDSPDDEEIYPIMDLEAANRLIERPAVTHDERKAKANAAWVLFGELTRNEFEMPENVKLYILQEYNARLDKRDEEANLDLEDDFEDSEYESKRQREREARLPAGAFRLHLDPEAAILIDEAMADRLVNNKEALFKATFVINDESEGLLQGEPRFVIQKMGETGNVIGIAFDCTDYDEVNRIEDEELKEWLLRSTMYSE